MSSIKNQSLKGSFWSLFDSLCTQGFSFFIGVILTRLLTPADYGTIGVTTIFIVLANVFVDCGFGNALIRKKDRSQEDLSTAFFYNFSVSIGVYIIIFLIAPFVASFFRMPVLVKLLRVLGLCVIFQSFSIVQTAILIANFRLKTIAIVNICTLIPMGCLGVFIAYKGMGVWTLVIQQVGNALLRSMWLWFLSKWKPSFVFSKESFHYLFNFGWKLLGANFIGSFFNEIYSFFIGRFLGSSELGLYTKAKQLSEYPRSIINSVINKVVLPVMVETQGDTDRIREVYGKLIRMLGLMIFPLFGLLFLVGYPLIIILWSEKWESTVQLFQLFCIGMAYGPFSTLNFCLLQLLNRTDLTLKLEFIKKPVCLAMLVAGIPFGLVGIVVSASLYCIVGTLINMYPTYKLLNYSYYTQLKDLMHGFILTFILVAILYYPMSLIGILWLRLIVSSISFIVLYIICSYLFNKKASIDTYCIILKK